MKEWKMEKGERIRDASAGNTHGGNIVVIYEMIGPLTSIGVLGLELQVWVVSVFINCTVL